MQLETLSIINYKNIEQADLLFCPKLNCFLGDNGAGKTNLLDAIYYLSFTKSFFNTVDGLNISHNKDFFLIQGHYNRNGDEEVISAGYKANQKKHIKRNKNPYKRFSDHIGLFPLVMISPSDSNLISGAGEERRKFMDGVISQYDRSFLDSFLRYNKALMQRNALLKQFAETRQVDWDTLSVYDEQLIEHGTHIFNMRKQFLDQLKPVFQHFYEFVSGGNESVSLDYESPLDQIGFRQILEEARKKDLIAQYTTVGVHRDDLSLMLGKHPMKKVGSQGQTKTYLVALKFAQFEFMKLQSGMKPILLLDDLFDKLDAKRVGKLSKVSDNQFGQIFLPTPTRNTSTTFETDNTQHISSGQQR
jgi:DNA replication and repair protein RecF